MCRFRGGPIRATAGHFVHQIRTPRPSPYGSRAQGDRSQRLGGSQTAGQDGRISSRPVGSPSIHQERTSSRRDIPWACGFSVLTSREPTPPADIRLSSPFGGCFRAVGPDRQAITTRRARRPPADDRAVWVIVMAWKSAIPRPGECGGFGDAAPDRTCTTHQTTRRQTDPARPRALRGRPTGLVSAPRPPGPRPAGRPAGPGWGGSCTRSGTRSSPPSATTDTTPPTAGTQKRRTAVDAAHRIAAQPPKDTSEQPDIPSNCPPARGRTPQLG